MSESVEVAVPDVQQVVSEAPPAPEVAGEGREVKPEEKEKPVKEKKPKKKTEKKPKHHKVAAHPPYFQMIKDAITALNEKNGSSPYAITKYIEAEHSSFLPANFRKILSLQLKNSTARGKLIKIKASYKLSQAGKKEKAATTRSARANAVKPEETVTKRRRSSRSKSVNQMQMEATEKAKAAAAGGRRMRKSAPATKPKQPKSIKSTVKKAKKAAAV